MLDKQEAVLQRAQQAISEEVVGAEYLESSPMATSGDDGGQAASSAVLELPQSDHYRVRLVYQRDDKRTDLAQEPLLLLWADKVCDVVAIRREGFNPDIFERSWHWYYLRHPDIVVFGVAAWEFSSGN